MEPRTIDPEWGFARRFAFRFCCVYMVAYIFPFPLQYFFQLGRFEVFQTGQLKSFMNFLGLAFSQSSESWRKAVAWVAQRLFDTTITVFTNGSGDTTFNYIEVFCLLCIALLVSSLWMLVAGGFPGINRNDVWIREWLRIYVRFYIAGTMFGYGAAKVIKSQFPSPTLDRLLQPIGDQSPMGLLWTFMGYSPVYNVFTGLGEMIGGILLTFRRTTLLGALVTIGVMAHVAALNFSYDVPVKLFSTHLILFAIFLTFPDLRRLANVFFLNRTAEPAYYRPIFGRPWMHYSTIALRTVLVVAIVGQHLLGAQAGRENYGDLAPRSPYRGIWNVEDFRVEGALLPPNLTYEVRWRRVVFDSPFRLGVQMMNNSVVRYDLQLDSVNKVLKLGKRGDPKWKTEVNFVVIGADVMTLTGTFDGKKYSMKIHRDPDVEFRLNSRGFNWINEYPYNY